MKDCKSASTGVNAELSGELICELIEVLADAVVIVDERGKIAFANAQTDSLFGYSQGELLGQRIEILIPDRLREQHVVQRKLYEGLSRPRPMAAGLEQPGRRSDGSEFPIEVSLSRLKSERGTWFISTICDITARRASEARLQEAEERFRLAFEHTPLGMGLVALDGTFTRVNRALCDLSGYSDTQLRKLTMLDLFRGDDVDPDLEQVESLLAGQSPRVQAEKRLVNAHGHSIWVMLAVSLVRDADGDPVHFVVQVEDVSDQKLLEQQLRRQAENDPLTGVHNRRQFERDLRAQVARCQHLGEESAVLMIDLDDFKQINDTHGHAVGDDVLRSVASAIRKRLRSTDNVARLGGDEFAVLLPHVSAAAAIRVAADIKDCVAGVTIKRAHGFVRPKASVGIAVIDEHAISAEAIVAEADRSMYASKRTSAQAQQAA